MITNNSETHSIYDEENGVIMGALAKGTDLMDGLKEEFGKYDFSTGMVTCIGSVSQAGFVTPFKNEDGTPHYSEPKLIKGIFEILNGTGFFCQNEQGEIDLHMHAMYVNEMGTIFGGHTLPNENPTLITIEFMIQVGKSVGAIRRFNPNLGFRTIQFTDIKNNKEEI
ncbi:PCC domain-containing protein [Neobacillus niacini]|uniref:PCC domain-containing protein n=1 Tax=Neobacillus niacini TaxID=86668 RepID=UPI003B015D10